MGFAQRIRGGRDVADWNAPWRRGLTGWGGNRARFGHGQCVLDVCGSTRCNDYSRLPRFSCAPWGHVAHIEPGRLVSHTAWHSDCPRNEPDMMPEIWPMYTSDRSSRWELCICQGWQYGGLVWLENYRQLSDAASCRAL